MLNALDVGAYIYKRSGWIDAWSLEKLTYFVQAWHLAWDGRRLIEDDFEAWPAGPVVPKLFQANKYERVNVGGIFGTELPGANPDAIEGQSQLIVDAVLDFYGHHDKDALIEMTHDDLPWKKARGDLARHARSSEVVTVSDMRRCYTSKMMSGSEAVPVPPNLQAVPVVVGARFQQAVDNEIERWSHTLSLLAER